MLRVSWDVASPLITSMSFITGTGFMKCIPITLSGLLVCAASLVIEIDEVFDANIVCGLVMVVSCLKIDDLTSKFSSAASTTKSQSWRSSS